MPPGEVGLRRRTPRSAQGRGAIEIGLFGRSAPGVGLRRRHPRSAQARCTD